VVEATLQLEQNRVDLGTFLKDPRRRHSASVELVDKLSGLSRGVRGAPARLHLADSIHPQLPAVLGPHAGSHLELLEGVNLFVHILRDDLDLLDFLLSVLDDTLLCLFHLDLELLRS